MDAVHTLTASLAKLPSDQQRATKTAAFDLKTNIAQPGTSLHRATGAGTPSFWSARVNLDLRIVLHRDGQNVVLCYVDCHGDAYRWAGMADLPWQSREHKVAV